MATKVFSTFWKTFSFITITPLPIKRIAEAIYNLSKIVRAGQKTITTTIRVVGQCCNSIYYSTYILCHSAKKASILFTVDVETGILRVPFNEAAN